MNVKLFGLTLDASGALKVMRDVTDASVSMAKEGAKNAQLYADAYRERFNRVARDYIPETIRAIERLRDTQRQASVGQQGPGMISEAEFARAEENFKRMTGAQEKAGVAAAGHGLQIGRLRNELGTLVGRMTGTSTIVDRMTGAIGAMAIGNPLTIGVLGGIAAIGYAYEKFTEQAKAAQKQAEDTRQEFDKIAHMGVAGQAEAASRLYSGDPFSTDKLAIPTLRELERQRADFAQRAKATQPFVGAFGITTQQMTKDAKESADALKLVNTELERRRTLLASITGPGGTLGRAGVAEAGANLPGMITDQLNEQKRAADQAAKAAEKLRHENAMTVTEAIDAADKANRARVEGVRGLEAEEDAEGRLLAALRLGTDAYTAQKDAEQARITVAHAGIKVGDEQYDEAIRAAKAIVEQRREVEELSATYKTVAEDVKAAVEKINRMLKEVADANKRYADDMRKAWLRGIEDITTNGLRSFRAFFESVYRLSTNLMKEMEKANDTNNTKYKALGIGTAALAGGFAGYNLGQQSGSAAVGALGGATSGALAGYQIAGAYGAVAGGLVGFVGGLLGAGSAAKEAAKRMEELRASLTHNLEALRAEMSGDKLGVAIAQVKEQFDALRKATEDAYSGGGSGSDTVRQRNAILAELSQRETERIRLLTEESNALAIANSVAASSEWKASFDDLNVRLLRTQGHTQAADDTAFRNQQNREIEAARLAGKDDVFIKLLTSTQVQEAIQRAEQIAIDTQTRTIQDAAAKQAAQFDEQIRTTQEALRVAEDQLRTQEQTVAATQKVVDSLTQFSQGLKLNTGLTTLSPVQQLVEAKKQFDDLLAQANAGNKDAAGNLPGSASAYLNASRAVNASGAGYVADFLRVQASIAAVTDKYGAQLSVEQQILAQLQQQANTLAAQLATLQAAKDAAAADAQRQIDAINGVGQKFNDFVNAAPWTDPAIPRTGFPSFPSAADIGSAVAIASAPGVEQLSDRVDLLGAKLDDLALAFTRSADAVSTRTGSPT